MADRNKEKVHLWVDPEKKSEWQAYVDESLEVDSLTQLVRNAVSVYMNQGGLAGQRNGVPEQSNVTVQQDNSEIIEGINRIESQISGLDDRLLSLKSMAEQSPELRDVMMKVHDVLPIQEPGSETHQIEKNRLTGPDEYGSFAWDGKPSTIAEQIDIEEYWVDMALRKLTEESERVKSRSNEGGAYYWKDTGIADSRYEKFTEDRVDE
jgi:hypothetical protein